MSAASSVFMRRLRKELKPLTQTEATRAIKAAVHYLEPELMRDGISRFRVLGVELAVTRPQSPRTAPKRQIEVIVIDYLNRRHMRVVIEQGRIFEVRALDYQPAVHSDEVAEATQLSATVPELRKLARRKNVFVSHYAPGRCEPGERRIGLYYLSTGKDGRTAILASAEVDLVEQRVFAIRLPGESSTIPLEGGTYGELR